MQARDKINGDVRPGMARPRQGLEELCRWLGTRLVPGTGGTGCDKGFDISCHGGQPKMCLGQGQHASGTWVTKRTVCVKPV